MKIYKITYKNVVTEFVFWVLAPDEKVAIATADANIGTTRLSFVSISLVTCKPLIANEGV